MLPSRRHMMKLAANAALFPVVAILNGRQPEGVTLPRLLEGVPSRWGEQRLGRASASGGMGY